MRINPEFPISTLSLRDNHTPAALAHQVQIDIAALGSHRKISRRAPHGIPLLVQEGMKGWSAGSVGRADLMRSSAVRPPKSHKLAAASLRYSLLDTRHLSLVSAWGLELAQGSLVTVVRPRVLEHGKSPRFERDQPWLAARLGSLVGEHVHGAPAPARRRDGSAISLPLVGGGYV